jgi:FkbM family methyltransferase
MKNLAKSVLKKFGFQLRRISTEVPPAAGSSERPIANIRSFLEDIKARGFMPRGILDVGANRGDWSRMALSIFPGTPIVMIEPQNEMEERLSILCKEIRNGHYIKAGAGQKEGVLVQTIWPDLAGSSFLPEVDLERVKKGEQRETKVLTIDGILAGIPEGFTPDLVKLDIQGFELEALKGGSRLFGKTEVFVVETPLFPFFKGMPLAREIIQFLADRGYEIYDITEYLRRPYDGAIGQVDFAFVKSAGAFRSHVEW